MKNIFFLFIALLLAGLSADGQNLQTKSLINTKSFSDSLQSNPSLVLLDVRTPEEFNAGHLKNALNVDFKKPDFKTQIADLDKTKTYYVYCKSGSRSALAAKEMRSQGFNNVYEMERGMLKWVANGMQTVKEVED